MKVLKLISGLTLFILLATGCQPSTTTPLPSTATSSLSAPTLASTLLVPTVSEPPAPTDTPVPTPTPTVTPISLPTATPTSEANAEPWGPVLPEAPCTPSATWTCQVLFVLPAQYYAESGRRYPDQFRDAGYAVTVASDEPEVVEVCENTVRADQPAKNIPVDLHLAEVEVADYDAIVFIGGLGCQGQWHDEQAHRIAQEAVSQGKVLGAAGCASTILAYAGVLQGKAATVCSSSPPVKHGQDYCAVLQSQGAVCSQEPITRDGRIVTAQQKSPYFVAGLIEVIMEASAPAPVPLLQQGPQEFTSPETFQAGLGDLDGDGDLDAVFANPMNNASEVWLNDGTGEFVNTDQQLTQYGHGVGVADFDGDGDLDAFIVCHQFVTPSRIYVNDGRGNLQDSGQDLGDGSISGSEVNLLDLNGDGHIDVHVLYYAPRGLADKVYLNDGTGTFTDSGLALDEETISWGDLDGDGDVDYFGKRWGHGYVVELNDGRGQFTEGWRMDDNQATLGGVALADLDGDGDLDALVANGFRDTGTYPGLVLWNDGGGQFIDSGQRLNETKGSDLAVGDLDNDGDLDVFVANMDWPNEVWLNEGGQFTDSGLRLGENRDMSGKPTLGDLDGDGDLDVVVGRFRGGAEIWFNTTIHTQQSSAPRDETPILGQNPPGAEVEVFAPGVVSIEEGKEYKIAISPDLQEIFFIRRTPFGGDDRLYYSHLEDGQLTIPELGPFAYDSLEADPCFTPDGKRVYFNSWRPLPGEQTPSERANVWFVDRAEKGWGEPKFLGSPLNDYRPVYFSIADDGTLYFTRSSPREIWYAEWVEGFYGEAHRLPDEINNLRDVAHPAIAPDESYLIVDSVYETRGRLAGGLYISFRNADGSWTEMVSMQKALKASETDIYAVARISPDGKYLFFESYLPGTDQADIYWISTEVIETLRPR